MFNEERVYYNSLDKEQLIEVIDTINNLSVKKSVKIKKLESLIDELTTGDSYPTTRKNESSGISRYYKSNNLKCGFELKTHAVNFDNCHCHICNLPFKIAEIKMNNITKNSGLKLCIRCLKRLRCMLNEIINDAERLMDEEFPKVGTKEWVAKLASVNVEK
mgnify:FL=1